MALGPPCIHIHIYTYVHTSLHVHTVINTFTIHDSEEMYKIWSISVPVLYVARSR